MNNNYTNNMVSYLNTYLANLTVLRNKLYNFHYNVVGPSFSGTHKKMQEYYEYFGIAIDSVAERIKMLEGYPDINFNDVINKSTIKDLESRDYYGSEIDKIVLADFMVLLNMTDQIGNYAANINDLNTLDLMTDITKFLEKQIWMLKASLK